jgi:hypothetical protein
MAEGWLKPDMWYMDNLLLVIKPKGGKIKKKSLSTTFLLAGLAETTIERFQVEVWLTEGIYDGIVAC